MATDQPVKVHVHLSCSHAYGADYDDSFDGPPRSEWNAMTEQQRDDYRQSVAETVMQNQVDISVRVQDGEQAEDPR